MSLEREYYAALLWMLAFAGALVAALQGSLSHVERTIDVQQMKEQFEVVN